MEVISEELRALKEKLAYLEDLLNCEEYRVDFNAVEQEIEDIKVEIEKTEEELKNESYR